MKRLIVFGLLLILCGTVFAEMRREQVLIKSPWSNYPVVAKYMKVQFYRGDSLIYTDTTDANGYYQIPDTMDTYQYKVKLAATIGITASDSTFVPHLSMYGNTVDFTGCQVLGLVPIADTALFAWYADSAGKIDTNYQAFQDYVENHAGGGATGGHYIGWGLDEYGPGDDSLRADSGVLDLRYLGLHAQADSSAQADVADSSVTIQDSSVSSYTKFARMDNPADGEIPTWNASQSKWEFKADQVGAGGAEPEWADSGSWLEPIEDDSLRITTGGVSCWIKGTGIEHAFNSDSLNGVAASGYLRSNTTDTTTGNLFLSGVYPRTAAIYPLGSATHYWTELYVRDIFPYGTDNDLGTGTYPWDTAHINVLVTASGRDTIPYALTAHNLAATASVVSDPEVDNNITIAGIAYVTGLQTALDGKSNVGHTHVAADVTSGTFDDARIPSGVHRDTEAKDGDFCSFDDPDLNFVATNLDEAMSELDNYNASGPNASDGKMEWSQLVGMPAGFADGEDQAFAGDSSWSVAQWDSAYPNTGNRMSIGRSAIDTVDIHGLVRMDSGLTHVTDLQVTRTFDIFANAIVDSQVPDNLFDSRFYTQTILGGYGSPTTSGAYYIGTYDEFTNSDATNVQAVLNDLDAAISGIGDITGVIAGDGLGGGGTSGDVTITAHAGYGLTIAGDSIEADSTVLDVRYINTGGADTIAYAETAFVARDLVASSSVVSNSEVDDDLSISATGSVHHDALDGQACIKDEVATITGIWTLSANWVNTANPWAVNEGGTGSGTASGARTNLGLVIGTDVEAHDATLTDIADGTIAENLVNTANPWAENEIVSTMATETEAQGYANTGRDSALSDIRDTLAVIPLDGLGDVEAITEAQGMVLWYDTAGTDNWSALAAGTQGYVLTMGANSAVTWAAAAGGIAEVDTDTVRFDVALPHTASGAITIGDPGWTESDSFRGLHKIDIADAAIADSSISSASNWNTAYGWGNWKVADSHKDTMIDWGTGAGQISTSDIPEGTNLYCTQTNIQTALSSDFHNIGGTDDDAPEAGDYAAASIDGDDINSNFAGRSLTLTAGSPDVLNADAELYTKCDQVIFYVPTVADTAEIFLDGSATIDSLFVYCRGGTNISVVFRNNGALVDSVTDLATGARTVDGSLTNTSYTSPNVVLIYVPALIGSVDRVTAGLYYRVND